MTMSYIWQDKNWPNFVYDLSDIQNILYAYAMETSSLSGSLSQLPEDLQRDAIIDLMVSEAIKTSEIEGERFDDEEVRSSIRKQLGLSYKPAFTQNPKAAGIAHLMISVRQTFPMLLSEEQLFEWHKMVMTEKHHHTNPDVGRWRSSAHPMQIVSGPIGREIVHYEAPPSHRINKDMADFIFWFNKTDPSKNKIKIPGPVRAAIVHLYFECIHPFYDGNGRIGRALSEKALSQELQRPVLLSLSTTIEKNKKEYYKELSYASIGGMNITSWINYFVKVIYQAQLEAKNQITFILEKAKFWNQYASILNDRQEKILSRMFKEGIIGFEGGISARKYAKIAECSKATATRDLAELLKYGCLEQLPGRGRSTSYRIKLWQTKFLL